MNKHAIILAAGKGTRMNIDVPKCSVKVAGKSMAQHIVDALNNSDIDDVVVVVGYKKEEMMASIDSKVSFATQTVQDGTAHACLAAKDALKGLDGITLVFPGDVPFIGEELISNLTKYHLDNKNDLTVVTTILDDAKSYGRIYRENGKFKRIIEFKDCTDEQKEIKEINVAFYCADTHLLFDAINKVQNNNHQHEYYLTDIVEIMLNDNKKVDAYIAKNDYHIMGVNTIEDKEAVERLYFEDKKNK